MDETIYNMQRMPTAGILWETRFRVTLQRTVTEDDLGDLKEDRAKYARDLPIHGEDWTQDQDTQTDEPLKMYELSRSPHAPPTWDTYEGAVVLAFNEDEAKFVHPRLGCPAIEDGRAPWWEAGSADCLFSSEHGEQRSFSPSEYERWCHPAFVRVKYICDYYGPEKSGHIVSSDFHPG